LQSIKAKRSDASKGMFFQKKYYSTTTIS